MVLPSLDVFWVANANTTLSRRNRIGIHNQRQGTLNREIAAGCGAGNFCPGNPNTRGQMAPFLVKTFGLLLYGP